MTYRSNMRQPDTSQNVGLIDWVGAVEKGANLAITIREGRDRHERIKAETAGLLTENAMNDMMLEETAVRHAAWMKNNRDGKLTARLAKSMAIQEANLDNALIETDIITKQTQKNRDDYIEMTVPANMKLLDIGRRALIQKNPSTALGVMEAIAQRMPSNTRPEIIELTAQLQELADKGVSNIFETNEAEASAQGMDEVTRNSQLYRSVSDFEDKADPYVQSYVGERTRKMLQNKDEGAKAARAADYNDRLDQYQSATGASREQSIIAMNNQHRMVQLGLDSFDDQLAVQRRVRNLQNGTATQQLDFLEGAQEENATVDQRALGREMAAFAQMRERQAVDFAKRRLELKKRAVEIQNTGVQDTMGGSSITYLTESRDWGTPVFVWSRAQNALMIEVDSRIQEINRKIDTGSAGNAVKLQAAKDRLVDLRKELGWKGKFFHIQEHKDTTKPVMKAVKDLHQSSHGYDADEVKASRALESVLKELDVIYKPTGNELERIQYELNTMDEMEAYTQDHLDYLSSFRTMNPAEATIPTEIQKPE